MERGESARRAVRALLELAELANARTVALYSAIGDEVPVADVATAVAARGGRVLYPVEAGADLELGWVADPRELEPARRGVLAPGARAMRVPAREVEAFVVPGLLFDRAGRRLGRGGGHYDRLLSRARPDAALIGICYADRVIDELPQEPWDVAMNLVVTESFVLRFDPRREAR